MPRKLETPYKSDKLPEFLCITRPQLVETNQLLERACNARGIAFVSLIPGMMGKMDLPSNLDECLLYRVSTDTASVYLEKLLFGPRTTAFHDPHFIADHQPITLLKSGVPVAQKICLPATDAQELAEQVDWLGGYPVVVKLAGTEGGQGVLLAEDAGELEYLLEQYPSGVLLEAFISHKKAYRLLVIGNEVKACTAASPGPDDFRSNIDSAHDLGPIDPPAGAIDIALAATTALRLEFGGVDILEDEEGALFVSEVNNPCYFAHQQETTGKDLAGAMIDYLLAKSQKTYPRPEGALHHSGRT